MVIFEFGQLKVPDCDGEDKGVDLYLSDGRLPVQRLCKFIGEDGPEDPRQNYKSGQTGQHDSNDYDEQCFL